MTFIKIGFEEGPRAMAGPSYRARGLLAAVLAAGVAVTSASAQQPAAQGAAPVPATGQPKAGKPAKAASGDAAASAAGAGDSGLRARVEQLEEQLVDLQVVIGTLESLAKSGGPRPAPSAMPMSGSDQSRLDGLETQVRALTAQVEQLAQEVRNAQGGTGASPQRRSDVDPYAPAVKPGTSPTSTASTAVVPADGPDGSGYADPPPAGVPGRFGSTTVTSGSLDEIGDLAQKSATPGAPAPGAAPSAPATPSSGQVASGQVAAPGQVAAIDPAVAGNPKQLYETAYGYLLQQDYGSAQAGFKDFLKRYPKDGLAPNAPYWLGETNYVQRNYADAAEAFDLVVSTYGTSNKAPDAQLKRGMALAQLGKKPEACAALKEVSARFPSASALLRTKADSERQRVGCP